MSVIAFILFIVAAVFFFVASDTVVANRRFSLLPLGLAVLTVGFIVQFCTHAHKVHF